jgi:ABC-type transport system involved in multi-copper enzyme maturation permease subunit
MTGLYYAEWKKVAGNRLLVGCLIWVWPLVACVGVALFTLILWLNDSARQNFEPISWTEVALIPWLALNNPLGRLLLVGFVAAVFAGEYQYQTWKTILPGNRRSTLILTKYVMTSLFIITALAITTLILVVSIGLMHWSINKPYEPSLDKEFFTDFLLEFGMVVLVVAVNSLLVSSVAALVALRTRTILFGVLAGIFVTLLDWLGIPTLLLIAAKVSGLEGIKKLVVLTPSFNFENIRYWIMAGEPIDYLGLGIHQSWLVSAVILAVWVAGLMSLSVMVFQQQDL